MPLFNRVCKVLLQTTEEKYLEFDQSFRIIFNVTKNDTSTPGNGDITIYNLSESTRNKLNKIIKINGERYGKGLEGFKMLIYAGYKDYKGLQFLFSADIAQIITSYQSPDLLTKISTVDGFFGLGTIEYPTSLINLSYKAGIDTNTIIKQVVDQMKMSIDSTSDWIDTNFKFTKGISVSGRAKDVLDKITGELNLTWYVEKNKVIIVKKKGGVTKQDALLISPDTGLLDIPQQSSDSGAGIISIGQNAPAAGWNIKTLLLPDAIPRRKIKIESETVKGIFIINTVAHAGDTWSGDWATTINALTTALI